MIASKLTLVKFESLNGRRIRVNGRSAEKRLLVRPSMILLPMVEGWPWMRPVPRLSSVHRFTMETSCIPKRVRCEFLIGRVPTGFNEVLISWVKLPVICLVKQWPSMAREIRWQWVPCIMMVRPKLDVMDASTVVDPFEFFWSGEEWLQRGNDIDGEQDKDFFGSSVALNAAGNMIVIGAPQTGDSSKRGLAYVYKWDNEKERWQKRGSCIEGTDGGDVFGSSVSISNPGETIAVGAYLHDGKNGDNDGHVPCLIGTKTRTAGHNVVRISKVKTRTTPVGIRWP
mmetsp:Transcript_31227/g.34973  ORF Transcript_31227/g.34973 Transcript_31227/m.34973 type:complete len:284 (+) Transcript_31227:627-1478(+)